MKITKKVRVKNESGLHTRPSTAIVQLSRQYKSHVLLTHKEDTVKTDSVLDILLLGVKKNAVVTITVEGDDAEEAMAALVTAFENRFGL